jgi:hypothetical protein
MAKPRRSGAVDVASRERIGFFCSSAFSGAFFAEQESGGSNDQPGEEPAPDRIKLKVIGKGAAHDEPGDEKRDEKDSFEGLPALGP